MSVLNANQRAVVRADTGIDRIIIDRVCDAFDALDHDDVEGYKRYMTTAFVQQGIPGPIPEHEKPTAVDKIKTICIRSCADQWNCSFTQAVKRLRRMTSG